jgi:hypothetical protein
LSREQYDDNCPGCKPAFIDLETGQVLADDHPTMLKIMAIWETTSRAQRSAYHRVMCLNSRDPIDLVIVGGIIERFKT